MREGDVGESSRWSIAAVIPVHNRARLVERAIDSVLAQERPADEIIVVDDGSTDDTAEIVAGYGHGVTLLRKPREGVSAARNLGIAHSNSDFIAFLDSDDLWDASHLDRMHEAIVATDGEAVLYFSDVRLGPHYQGETFWDMCDFGIDDAYELRRESDAWLFCPRQPMVIPASVVRRDVYLGVGGSEDRLVRRGDTHLFFKISLAGPICAVAGIAGDVTRDDPKSVSSTFPPDDETYLDCTIWLYGDLLQKPHLTSAQRATFARRLADGHWQIAKQKAARAPLGALVDVARAMRRDPAIVAKRVRSRLQRLDLGVARRSANGSIG